MKTLDAYFQAYLSDRSDDKAVIFPNVKSEEYRYSMIVPKLASMVLDPFEKGRIIDVPWESDYNFFSGHQSESFSLMAYDQLSPYFFRHQNYFKQANIAKDPLFYNIEFPESRDTITLTFAGSKGSLMDKKVFIRVGANRKVKIYINFLSEHDSLMMPLVFVEAGADSHVEIIYVVPSLFNQGVILPVYEFIAQKSSNISLQTFTEGIEFHRLAFIGYLAGAESHIDLRTGFCLRGKETCDLYVRMFHEAPDSTSNQMIKAATFDSSTMNFNGQIYANHEAKNIYAYQMLKGMLLGEDSQIFARPQLDIEYFELACSHGVSIGGFDPEELFYLRSRGVADKDVYPLLLYGFFAEPFMELDLEDFWVSKIKAALGTEAS